MTVQTIGNIAGENIGSPEWWVRRLYKQLTARRPELQFYDDYYTGNHPLPWLAPQAREEFRRILEMTRANVMGLVCDATVERVHVEGFRFGEDAKSDADSWRIWQGNNLDSDSDIGWLESCIGGISYFMVEPNEVDSTLPRIALEHGSQAITEAVPGNRRLRKAGLKLFVDDWTGLLNATLFLMDDTMTTMAVFKYEADNPHEGTLSDPEWRRRTVPGEEWGGAAQLAAIPLVPIRNNPRLLTGGRSELYDLTDIQDRINKTLADRLITQDYGAFPQKWAVAWPQEDEEGHPNTIDIGRNRMVTTEVEQTKFGQFTAAELDPYSNAKREDVKDIASRSRTPAQYLLGEMSNVNGETLKASESGLIAKVRQRMRPWGEAAEEAMRLARILGGVAGDQDPFMETVFANPEFRTEGEVTDAAIKRLQSGISSQRQARVDVGYSQTTINQMEKEDTNQIVAPIIQQQLQQARLAGNTSGANAPVAD
jgi:hypothetical protein